MMGYLSYYIIEGLVREHFFTDRLIKAVL